jgi:hypothetical protein
MLSEKLITMISGVITLRSILSRKPSYPSAPMPSRIAIKRHPAATTMNEARRKKSNAIRYRKAKPTAL